MLKNTNRPSSNKYDPVLLPVDYNRSFLDLSNEEIEQYYKWFLGIKGIRLANLCQFLFSDIKNYAFVGVSWLINDFSTLKLKRNTNKQIIGNLQSCRVAYWRL